MSKKNKTKVEIPLFNRELSWIEFNRRVLAEAENKANPLLERLMFLGIVSSNFDEFFMVRLSSTDEPENMRREIYHKAFEVIKEQNDYFIKTLGPELEQAGIVRVLPYELSEKEMDYLRGFFHTELIDLLTPIAIHEELPIPLLTNLRLYRVAELVNPDQPEVHKFAVIEVPKTLDRMVTLPSPSGKKFILIEDVISLFMGDLFQGYEIFQQGLLRITRAAEMTLDEEKDQDFAKVMSEALQARRQSPIVRLEVSGKNSMVEHLKECLQVSEDKVLRLESTWFDFKGISSLAFQPGFDSLKRPQWKPRSVVDIEETDDIWEEIKKKDILIHRPYDSFDAFTRFLSEAAQDPDVLAIKQTLYRTGENSSVISLLEEAVENGKQVTVLIELKARFDEKENITGARRLEKAGAIVLYGVQGLKTHAKACLVVRREVEGIRRYLHLSTGNYNEKTAKLYTDLSLFTAKDNVTQDVSAFFNLITGFSQPSDFKKIEIAPFGLRRKFKRLIKRETMRKSGLIMAKMNSLVDPDIIEALYQASQKGVKIKLNIRGICCLKPGVKGLSENIEVVSVIGQFLEHSRIFYFKNDGDEDVYLSSADWMPRNLDRRLEILFPVEGDKNKKRVIQLMKNYFLDNQKAWRLTEQGDYKKVLPGNEKPFAIQEHLKKLAKDREKTAKKRVIQELKPQTPQKKSTGSFQIEPPKN